MVKGTASPYDGNTTYWVNRKSELYADSPTGKAMKRQKLRCAHCNEPFLLSDIVELHHADGDHNNWKRRNLKAMHRECHQYQEVHKDRIKEGIS